MMIAVPSGVKMFNWLGTMWGGSISFTTPMLFAIGFLFMFLIGGVDGVFNAVVPVDYALNDTYWVVSHIHYVLFGGSVFGVFAGVYYWFPKMTGKMLDETLGKIQFVLMFIGFNLTFFPMHMLGLDGHAAAHRDVRVHGRLEPAQPDLATIGSLRHRRLDAAVPVERVRLAAQRQDRRRRPVGGQHARVGHQLAAAAVQLRPPAGDPLRAAGLRRPPRPDRTREPRVTASTAVTTTHGEAAGHGRERGGISNPILGMILFICSEVMFFAGLFAAYFNVRANAPIWPPSADEVGPIAEKFNLHAEPFFAAALTLILVISSFTCQLGVWAIRRGDRRGLIRAIGLTMVLGIVFLIGQAYDYSQLGFGLSDGTFGTTFYTLTGFHGAHVLGGVIMLSVVLYRSMGGQFSAKHHDAVEATSIYWHFVDVVWIALFSILYIIPTH